MRPGNYIKKIHPLLKGVRDSFLRLNIAKKLLLGYLSLAMLLVTISVYALLNLERLNSVNSSILQTDVPLMDISDKLMDNLLAQELYARRYVILQSPDMMGLFWQRSADFNTLVERIADLPDAGFVPLQDIRKLHEEYNGVITTGMKRIQKGDEAFPPDVERKIKEKQDALMSLINGIRTAAMKDQNEKTLFTSNIGSRAFRVTSFLCVLGILLGVGAAMLITRNISGSINQLKLATQRISEGVFDETPVLRNQDELGELSGAFRDMAARLKRLEEMYLDASPLTKLPGGIAIQNVLDKRLETAQPLAFCLVDMDNFKAYNDHYGYGRGNDVILALAGILEDVTREHGTEDDFIGHIGGDDFVIITTPDRFRILCNSVIERFDAMIPGFYDTEDRERGYIRGVSRQGEDMQFPIITLSIAVVTNITRPLTNHIEVGEIAAELKEYAKSLPGSGYVVDKRRERERTGGETGKIVPFPKSEEL